MKMKLISSVFAGLQPFILMLLMGEDVEQGEQLAIVYVASLFVAFVTYTAPMWGDQ
tara:strand:+ start:756 stop:923 length:168 start_codon:yes stop_codon:yes gene_type:complete